MKAAMDEEMLVEELKHHCLDIGDDRTVSPFTPDVHTRPPSPAEMSSNTLRFQK